jgi:oxalate decarboxylase/phosphoglucose isomerase-like protein (cupin superfamily)
MDVIKKVVNFKDERGEIVDLIEDRNINAVTFISFTKGSIRANHYHKETTQWNYLLKGKIKLVVQIGDGAIEERILEPGDLVSTAPMEKHALVGIEDSDLLVFTEGPRGGKEYESDTFRLENPIA